MDSSFKNCNNANITYLCKKRDVIITKHGVQKNGRHWSSIRFNANTGLSTPELQPTCLTHMCNMCMANQPVSTYIELYLGQLNAAATMEAIEFYCLQCSYVMPDRASAATCV